MTQDPPQQAPDTQRIDPEWQVRPGAQGPLTPPARDDVFALPYQGPRFETRDETFDPPEFERFAQEDDRTVREHRRDARREVYDGLRDGDVSLGALLRLGLSSAILNNADDGRTPDQQQRDRQDGVYYDRDGQRRGLYR